MKMQGRKAAVFWVTLVVLVALFLFTAGFAGAALPQIGPVIVIMIVGNGASYIGGAVWDAWQRSKYYRSELEGK